ncbi:MAG: L,D-transpeptidase family protein [Nitrospinae bacterium]|nr:L,D-transpeptidase family protein [Nitrospinota bacterium]
MRDSALRRLELEMYKARVGVLVHFNNMKVRGAFDLGGDTPPFKKVAVFAMMALFALSVISWAVTAPIKTVSAPLPITTAAIPPVSPAPPATLPPVEIKMDPYSALFRDMPDISELPSPRQSLPAPSGEAIHTVVVDKSRRELFVLEETQDNYIIVARYPVSLGAERGDKVTQGDNKTPEGLYRITEIKNEKLPQKYGPRAYVLNYPNDVDRRQNKSGYGIWLHGSGMGDKTKPTEGCVQLNDFHIIALGEYAGEGASVYIFPEGFELPVENGAIQKSIVQSKTLYALKEWRDNMIVSKNAPSPASSRETGG